MAAASIDNHTALRHKNDGNALFSKCKFKEAAACYTEGIRLTTTNTNNDGEDFEGDGDLRAVLLSNRSSCYYEMGDYERSTNDGKACAALLLEIEGRKLAKAHEAGDTNSPFTLPPLYWKNSWRLARSLHFGNKAPPGEVHFVLNSIEKETEEKNNDFASKASKMREQLMYYQNIDIADDDAAVRFEPSPIRASFQNPYYEYYNFGHDDSESLLVHRDIESQSIHLKDLTNDELSSLAFLFGGVGDARHVFATLLDAHHQFTSLPTSQQECFKLHITLNDISSQLLAKDLLVLVLSYEMGRMANDCEDALSESEPYFLGTVIMYVTLGHAMPKTVYMKMTECIKCFFTESSREEFLKQFPWLKLSVNSWEGIIQRMAAWIDPEGLYSPKLPSVKKRLSSLNPSDNSMDGVMGDLASLGASGEVMSGMQDKFIRAKEENKKRRLEAIEMIKTQELSPHFITMAKEQLGENATEQEMRDYISNILASISDEDLGNPRSMGEVFLSPFDNDFYEMTNALIVHSNCPVDILNQELAPLYEMPVGNKTEAAEAISQYKPKLFKTWVTNPVQIDPLYYSFMNGNIEPDNTNHLKDWTSMFFNESVLSTMISPPLSLSNCQDHDKIRKSNSLSKNVVRYYWNVGKVMNNLKDKVVMEVALGSIIGHGACSNRDIGLPTEYHRISLSNIPDYTGMLSVYTTIAPILESKSESITPSLRSNCLLNTGLWKTYDDYIFSTAALSYKEAEAIFHLSIPDKDPHVYNSFTTWERADENVGNPAMTHEKLRRWMHSLYLNIILPPDRDPNSTLREERASTIDLFLLTLSRVCKLGIPAHIVSSVLDDLLTKENLVTKGMLSNDSPASMTSRDNLAKKKYCISAFQSELANQTAIFMQNNMLGFKVLATKNLPAASASLYSLKLGGINSQWSPYDAYRYGRTVCNLSLGFMLTVPTPGGKRFGISSGASNGNFNPMMAMMMAQMGEDGDANKKSSKLRKALLDSGDMVGHVFSCMQWDLQKQVASFWMCDDMFKRYKNYSFTLIRTDGWFQIPHEEVRLGDAQRNLH